MCDPDLNASPALPTSVGSAAWRRKPDIQTETLPLTQRPVTQRRAASTPARTWHSAGTDRLTNPPPVSGETKRDIGGTSLPRPPDVRQDAEIVIPPPCRAATMRGLPRHPLPAMTPPACSASPPLPSCSGSTSCSATVASGSPCQSCRQRIPPPRPASPSSFPPATRPPSSPPPSARWRRRITPAHSASSWWTTAAPTAPARSPAPWQTRASPC